MKTKKKKSHFKTIKTTFKSVIKDSENISIIENLVSDINDLVIHTYQFIRLYILYLYKEKNKFPEINENFILNCFKTLGIKDNRGIKKQNDNKILCESLDDFYNKEYQPLFNHKKTNIIGKTQILSYLSIQIYTNITVNIQEHFIQHLFRFVNITTKDITEDKSILHKFKKQFALFEEIDNDLFNDWMEEHKNNILPDNIEKSVYYDIKVRPLEYLKGLIYMNSVLENQGSKLFQVLPLRTNIIPKHIIIDTTTLVYLFCKGSTKLVKNINDNKGIIWSSFLKTESKIFRDKHYRFYNQIQTDGISCSLLFIRKDISNKKFGTKTSKTSQIKEQEFYNIEDLSKEQLDSIKNRNVVGCDPNKRSLVYMVDNNNKRLQYTSPQRNRESKVKHNKRILLIEKNKNGIIKLETELSKYNCKTVDYDKFKEYLIKKNQLNEETKEFYNRETWRKMSFRTYSYGRKSIDKFLNRISEVFGPAKDIVIGYGNWSRSTQMKNYEPTMNKGLRKLIHKRYDTITINEHNTSKKCCDCHHNLVYHKDSEGKKLHRLLKCVSAEHKQTVFKTRDVNSAINIRNITSLWILEQRRLDVFCRTKHQTDTDKSSFINS
jgi:hypothetical protein